MTIKPRRKICNAFSKGTSAKTDLSWVPEITLDEMITEMVSHDLDLAKQHALLKANGYNVDVSKE